LHARIGLSENVADDDLPGADATGERVTSGKQTG